MPRSSPSTAYMEEHRELYQRMVQLRNERERGEIGGLGSSTDSISQRGRFQRSVDQVGGISSSTQLPASFGGEIGGSDSSRDTLTERGRFHRSVDQVGVIGGMDGHIQLPGSLTRLGGTDIGGMSVYVPGGSARLGSPLTECGRQTTPVTASALTPGADFAGLLSTPDWHGITPLSARQGRSETLAAGEGSSRWGRQPAGFLQPAQGATRSARVRRSSGEPRIPSRFGPGAATRSSALPSGSDMPLSGFSNAGPPVTATQTQRGSISQKRLSSGEPDPEPSAKRPRQDTSTFGGSALEILAAARHSFTPVLDSMFLLPTPPTPDTGAAQRLRALLQQGNPGSPALPFSATPAAPLAFTLQAGISPGLASSPADLDQILGDLGVGQPSPLGDVLQPSMHDHVDATVPEQIPQPVVASPVPVPESIAADRPLPLEMEGMVTRGRARTVASEGQIADSGAQALEPQQSREPHVTARPARRARRGAPKDRGQLTVWTSPQKRKPSSRRRVAANQAADILTETETAAPAPAVQAPVPVMQAPAPVVQAVPGPALRRSKRLEEKRDTAARSEPAVQTVAATAQVGRRAKAGTQSFRSRRMKKATDQSMARTTARKTSR